MSSVPVGRGKMRAGLVSPARGPVRTDGAVQKGSVGLGERYQCQR